jgi:signal transduction histidine kinase
MTEVEESRHRLVTTSAVELRRIGRDLHDGAQQRLVGILFHLRATSTAASDRQVRDELAGAEEAVTGALSTLRDIAHRHAGSTTTAGLIPSIRESLWRAGVPATVRGTLTCEPPAEILHVLTGVLRSLLDDVATRPGATRVEVAVTGADRQLEVVVRDDGSDDGTQSSARRADAAVAVASAGGTLTVRDGGSRSAGVEVTLRCGW